jgi:nucleoside-diphosphate-sugar epimerase
MNSARDVVIVTGSSGFIGSAVIEKLAGRFKPIGFDLGMPPQPHP